MRIGLFGGAFNPPHLGHLRVAELALQHLRLDALRFMPTAGSPHKPRPAGEQGLSGASRTRLLEELLRALPASCSISTAELERGGTSYTVDTLEALHLQEPGQSWILVVGGDQLPDFPRWRRADRILELAALAGVPRPGFSQELPESLGVRMKSAWSGAPGEFVWLPPSGEPWASTHLREQLREGIAAEGLPREVLAVIESKNLYRS